MKLFLNKAQRFLFTIIVLVLQLTVHHFSNAQTISETKKTVYTFQLNQEIAAPAWRLVNNCFNEAEAMNADYIIIQLNTFGGELSNADLIRNRILKSKIPVYVLVDGNAASAGALISIACNKIFMKPGSTIGAASVVNETGEIMPDKYQSYMRGMMRATAEQRERDPKIAEGMVSSNNYLSDIADSGKVITLTTTEAMKYKYCDGIASDINEVCALAGITNYNVKIYERSTLDVLIDFLLNPIVNSILLMVIIAGIYFEFQHPGLGAPLFAGIAAAVLYFAPLYVDGLAANWEILVFVIGIILLIAEIFFIPGFGVTGALGIIFIVTSLTLSLIANDFFDFTYSGTDNLLYALLRVVLVIIIGITGAVFLGRKFLTTTVGQRVVLTTTLEDAKSFSDSVSHLNSLIGQTGIAMTDLRPAGSVEINSVRHDSISDGDFISRNDKVKVIEIRGNYLVVRKSV
ncbi:MAG: nodulation protein NfeD [Sphingobacteriales bacterium]|nr:MAG: nodulation protein NfeD [Sphingobacteriales bacterium]